MTWKRRVRHGGCHLSFFKRILSNDTRSTSIREQNEKEMREEGRRGSFFRFYITINSLKNGTLPEECLQLKILIIFTKLRVRVQKIIGLRRILRKIDGIFYVLFFLSFVGTSE